MFKLVRIVAVAALCAVAAVGVVAQTFTKPIKVIVPYPAGDLGDVISRLLQQSMQESLGQPIVIENRPGASGLLGLQSALQGPNDGHTFVMGQMGSMAVAPITNKQPIDVRAEFVPVAMAYTIRQYRPRPYRNWLLTPRPIPASCVSEPTVKVAFRTCLWNCYRSALGWASSTCRTRATIRYWPT